MVNISFNEYTYLMIRISYWLLKNNKKFNKRKTYTHGKNKLNYEDLKKKILSNRTKYNTTVLLGRLAEYAILDNKDTSFLPNYVTGSNKVKYSKTDYIKMCKWTINYETKNGHRPDRVNPGVTKFGHATIQGCDNMGQNTPYYCGVHSLQEVFRNLTNIIVPQSTIAGWAGTTSSGTGHNGLETAVAKFNKKYNKKLKVTWKNFSDLGWDGVNKLIKSNNQDVIIHNRYRNKYGHYEVVNSISGSTIKVQNSLGSRCSRGCYCGYVESRDSNVFKSYIGGISQKSVMIISNSG